MTNVQITIDTDDLALVERIGKALNGSATTVEGPQVAPPPASDDRVPGGFTERAQAAQNDLDDVRRDMTPPPPTPAPDTKPEPKGPDYGDAARAFGRAGTATEQASARPAGEERSTPTAESGATHAGAQAPASGATAPANKPHHDTPRATPGEELDEDGLPWDDRINTSNKTQTQGGVWKRKPRITDELYNEVREELKATTAGAIPAPEAATPPPPPAPEQTDDNQPEPEQLGHGHTPPPPPPGQPVADIKFPQLVRRVTAEKVDTDTLNQTLNRYGVTRLPDLIKRPDLVPDIYGELFPGG